MSSGIPRLSSMSDRSRRAVKKVLEKQYSDVRITLIDDRQDLDALLKRRPDLVFLAMKFLPKDFSNMDANDDVIWIAKFLDQNDITYTGSPSVAHKLGLNKPMAKARLLQSGLSTAAYQVIKLGGTINKQDIRLQYPLFIKPANRGGGLGVDERSLVNGFEQLKLKVGSIFELGSDALIEEYLPGREFSVAILKRSIDDKLMALPIELVAERNSSGVRMLSGDTKLANSEQVKDVTDINLRNKVTTLALESFIALGARDYGRVDIRLDSHGVPHFLEANLMPSLIEDYGSFPKACVLNLSLEYEDMILSLVNLANSRYLPKKLPIEDLLLDPVAVTNS